MRYVVLGLIAFGLALYVLGMFALPAIVGVLIAGNIAIRRGLDREQTLRLVAAVSVLLLLAGLVLSMLFVPTVRMVRGSESPDDASGSRSWVMAPTSVSLP